MALALQLKAPLAGAPSTVQTRFGNSYTPDINGMIAPTVMQEVVDLLAAGWTLVDNAAVAGVLGLSTALFLPEGNINRQSSLAGVGNAADTTDDTLFTYTLPANAFDVAGRGICITAFGKFAANGNNKQAKLFFGATAVCVTGVVTSNALGWALQANVFKVGAVGSNTQIAQGYPITGATHLGASVPSTPTETESGPVVVKCTGASGTTGAASDVLGQFFEINAMN